MPWRTNEFWWWMTRPPFATWSARTCATRDSRSTRRLTAKRPSPVSRSVLPIWSCWTCGCRGIGGLDVLREIRRTSAVYVIVLTARADEADKLIGLELGADDYITKPFSPRELVARVRAVLRRRREGELVEAALDEVTRLDGLTIDVGRHEVRVDDEPVELTSLEFQLLATLVEAPGRVFTRRQLIERVWGWATSTGDERLVDVHIGNLRRAIGDAADDPWFIGTVRGAGYKCVGAPL